MSSKFQVKTRKISAKVLELCDGKAVKVVLPTSVERAADDISAIACAILQYDSGWVVFADGQACCASTFYATCTTL